MLDFVAKFTDKKIKIVKIGTKFFLENKQLAKHKLDAKEKIFGLYLGEQKDTFVPSFGLLNWLAEHSEEKVFVKDIGEIDFLYGKNLRARHVARVEGSTKIGFLKLIQNEHDENLGYGKIVGEFGKTNQVVKHRMDRGHFLAREKVNKVDKKA
jgi:ribosome biogenesis protein Nip4